MHVQLPRLIWASPPHAEASPAMQHSKKISTNSVEALVFTSGNATSTERTASGEVKPILKTGVYAMCGELFPEPFPGGGLG